MYHVRCLIGRLNVKHVCQASIFFLAQNDGHAGTVGARDEAAEGFM